MADYSPTLPPPLDPDAHKGMAGRLLCLCGSPTMPGAASLVVRAAHRAGAGLVTLVVFQQEMIGHVAPLSPETMYLDVSRSQDLYAGRVPREITDYCHDVRVVGPGLSRSGRTRELVRRIVEGDFQGPTLFDADALAVLAGIPEVLAQANGSVVLTPHAGEAASLLDRDIPSDAEGRIMEARELANRSGATVVLKGRGTVVTDGEHIFVCKAGNPGMATAGSGDVLSGIVGAYLCSIQDGYTPFDAVAAAVQVHSRAGDLAAESLGERALIASDLIAHLPMAQRELLGSTSGI